MLYFPVCTEHYLKRMFQSGCYPHNCLLTFGPTNLSAFRLLKQNPNLKHLLIDSGTYSLGEKAKKEGVKVTEDMLNEHTQRYKAFLKEAKAVLGAPFMFVEVDVGTLGRPPTLTYKYRQQLKELSAEIGCPLMVVWHGTEEPLSVLWGYKETEPYVAIGSPFISQISMSPFIKVTLLNLLAYPLVREKVWVHQFMQGSLLFFLYGVATSADSTGWLRKATHNQMLARLNSLSPYITKVTRYSVPPVLRAVKDKFCVSYYYYELLEAISEERRPINLAIWEDLYKQVGWDDVFKGRKEDLVKVATDLTRTRFHDIFYDLDKVEAVFKTALKGGSNLE